MPAKITPSTAGKPHRFKVMLSRSLPQRASVVVVADNPEMAGRLAQFPGPVWQDNLDADNYPPSSDVDSVTDLGEA